MEEKSHVDYCWDAVQDEEPEHKEAYQYWLENGKVDINKLLWTLLPGNVTLDEADKLAVEIYYMINERWDNV